MYHNHLLSLLASQQPSETQSSNMLDEETETLNETQESSQMVEDNISVEDEIDEHLPTKKQNNAEVGKNLRT